MISVIVPVYKVEEYLRRCVDSVLAQTYRDFELILVDDGSPDHCGQICDEYAAIDRRIKVIHQENGGISAARNAGLDVAQGEYVAFVDSDDYCHAEMLRVLYEGIVQYGADVAVSGYKRVDKSGNENENDVKSYLPKKNELIDRREGLKRLCVTESNYLSVLWNKIYKRNLFESIRFPIGKLYEDDFVTPLIFNRCDLIAMIPQFLYYYVDRDDSTTGGRKTVRHFDFVESRFLRVKFLQSLGFPQEDVVWCAGNTAYMYWRIFDEVEVKNFSSKERKRYLEIKQMVRYCYKITKEKIPQRVKFEFPRIYRLIRCVKKATRVVFFR